jgi:fructokinase
MNLVDAQKLDDIRSQLDNFEILPGGSGANTARGVAWLNHDKRLPVPLFYGAVGHDATGEMYLKKLEEAGVRSGISLKNEPSGVSVILVTPDFERTMFTHLGACRTFCEEDVDFSLMAQTALVHVTGYMWDTPNQKRVAERAVAEAKRAGTPVSLDLADPFVVTRYREQFLGWITGNVDLLFGNREEFALLCDEHENDEAVLTKAAALAPTIIMKAGAYGAYVASAHGTKLLPGFKVEARDTTGAGDSFAAGYLYTMLSGRDPSDCARAGNRLAASIVAVEGCDYDSIDYSGAGKGPE